ncbi:C2 domain [Plasmopara halstedii]|uniref:C2 domain n=1 Tax=Plasmopara halstedii TaxID=4781 RepID=A0A0P1AIJ9_PLAHL|nr:C2 domain [Plasmopara halstedii]CEG41031.1 C2 domain [Plasmopara halstedii]|eukprot:XP_024577400.1 C2 domain [Plasmopara halstedii]
MERKAFLEAVDRNNHTLPTSRFTLFLRVHSAQNLATTQRGSYCKLYLGNTNVISESASIKASLSHFLVADSTQERQPPPPYRVFRTKVVYTNQSSCPEWNEKLELDVFNPKTEILTIRVKSQMLFFCPVIGVCAIPLCNVQVGELVDQWFHLYKQEKPVGHIRLQLMLKENNTVKNLSHVVASESTKHRSCHRYSQQDHECHHSVPSHKSRCSVYHEERDEGNRMEVTKEQGLTEMSKREQVTTMEFKQDDQEQQLEEKLTKIKVMEDETSKFSSKSSSLANDDAMYRGRSGLTGMKQNLAVAEKECRTNVGSGRNTDDALPLTYSSSDEKDVKQSRRRRRRKKDTKRKDRSRNQKYVQQSSTTTSQADTPQNTTISPSAMDSSSSNETSSSEIKRRHHRHKARKSKKKALPPQPQQKWSMTEKIRTAADMASILSDMASVAASVHQITGGGDVSDTFFDVQVPNMNECLVDQNLTESGV